MFKYFAILAAAISIICLQSVYAETCPKVSEIKKSHLTDWKAYDSDDGKPLSSARAEQFNRAVEAFVLAEWSDNTQKKGSIHCYYRDKSGSNLEAYLAKENYHPKKLTHHFWYTVSGHMHCAASSKQCEFESDIPTHRCKRQSNLQLGHRHDRARQ